MSLCKATVYQASFSQDTRHLPAVKFLMPSLCHLLFELCRSVLYNTVGSGTTGVNETDV